MIDKQLLRRMPGESEEDYKLRICGLRVPQRLTWQEIADIINDELCLNHSESKYRKEYNLYLRGREDAIEEKETKTSEEKQGETPQSSYPFDSDEELLREKYYSSTERTPYYRLMRQDARFERFYKCIAEEIRRMPVPDFLGTKDGPKWEDSDKEFVVTLADLHIGACFETVNNAYSMKIAQERFEILLSKMKKLVEEHGIVCLKILSLGDIVQGILRVSDLKLNEAPVVDALVFAMRLLSQFLNKLSQYCYIEFLQVCYSNHDQIRPLGTKASELGSEDMGKILFAYLKDVLADNPRITIIGDTTHDYLEFKVFDFNCIALHGHQINSVNTVARDLTNRHHKFFDYVFLGHTHSAKEFISGVGPKHNIEVLVSSSFIGECPYAEKLMVSSKASVKIFEFDETYGHVGSYNIILG